MSQSLARSAMPSSRILAPSLASRSRQRSTISSAGMCALLDLQGLGLGADQRLDLGIDHALALVVVLVIAGARLLPVPAHLHDLVGDARELRRLAGELPLLADAVADVEAGEIAHRQRPHGHAPALQRAVDLLRHGAFERHGLHLAAVGGEHAVAHEAVAHAGLHADLADLLGDRHGGRHHVVGGLLGTHDLEQPHDVGGREEMQAHHVLRPLRHGGDLVDVERGGVAGDDGARLGDFVELLEDLLLERHVLEHGLDDEVGLAEVRHLQRRRELGDPVRRLRLGDAPALGIGRERILDAVDAAVERILRGLDDRHGEAAVEEGEADAGAHGAGAQDADGLDVAQLGIGADARQVGGLALGEEGVLQGARVGARRRLAEHLPLARLALVDGQRGRGLDRIDGGLGRDRPARMAAERGARLLEQPGGERGLVDLLLADAARRLAHLLLGEGNGRSDHVAVGKLVDQAGRGPLLRVDERRRS